MIWDKWQESDSDKIENCVLKTLLIVRFQNKRNDKSALVWVEFLNTPPPWVYVSVIVNGGHNK